MAKLSSIQKNLFRKTLIQKYKSKRELLKSKIKDKKISLEERIVLLVYLMGSGSLLLQGSL